LIAAYQNDKRIAEEKLLMKPLATEKIQENKESEEISPIVK